MYDTLIAMGFSEEEITTALGISHLRLRRSLKEPQPRLCYSCAQEILHTAEGTRAEIARQYRTTQAEISRVFYRPLQPPTPPQPPEGPAPRRVFNYQEIARYHKEGLAPQEIAQRLDCPPSSVYTTLAKLGLTNSYGYLTEDEWQALFEDYADGDRITHLANKYGISRAAIYKRMQR